MMRGIIQIGNEIEKDDERERKKMTDDEISFIKHINNTFMVCIP